MSDVSTSVLIVGGAGSGLASAIFLARLGIDYHLVERYPTTSPAPKAHYLNQRTMEIFREVGISEDIYSRSTPAENMSTVGWYTSLGGTGELDAKTIHVMDAFGGNSLQEKYQRHSPCRAANFAQLYLEPLLHEYAAQQPLANLNYGHELIDFEERDDGIVAEVLNKDSGETYTVNAKYMLGCDGGRFVADKLDIKMEGIDRLFDMITVHFEGDLSAYIEDDSPMIRWFINPESGGSWGSGVLVALGPDSFGKHSKEWLMHFAFDPESANFVEPSVLKEKILTLLKLPEDFSICVKKTNNWKVQGVLAEKFRRGRTLLLGDSAHRHPPTTGLGLNSAIQDAHNVAWKLAYVLRGEASDTLLDSYEQERQAVTRRNVSWALFTFQNHLVIDAGIGLIPGAPIEVNKQAFTLLFSDTPEGETRRARLNEVIRTQRAEFQAQDLEIGFNYNSAAIIADGSAMPVKSPLGDGYVASSRPGHRLPHAWIETDAGRSSTLDLIDGKQFTLITGSGKHWTIDGMTSIRSVSIGDADADCRDVDDQWREVSGIEASGAILVRPDGHVCWRAAAFSESKQLELTSALATVLAQ